MASWSAADQAVYDALVLDARLGGGGAVGATTTLGVTNLLKRRTRGQEFDPWGKLPRWRGLIKDPVWFFVRLLWAIPYNIVYIAFQLLRTWVGRRSVMFQVARGDLVLGGGELAINVMVAGGGPGGVRYVPYRVGYAEVQTLGQYDNGILLEGRQPVLLATPDDAEALVRLTHLVPAARIAHGLQVRPDFEAACAARGLSLAHLPGCRNAPETWSRAVAAYVPPMPSERKVALGVIAGLVVLVLVAVVQTGVLG